MKTKQQIAVLLGALGAALAIAALGGGSTANARAIASCQIPKGGEHVRLDPNDFTTRIDNAWWPMRSGSRWVYRETDPDGTKQRWW